MFREGRDSSFALLATVVTGNFHAIPIRDWCFLAVGDFVLVVQLTKPWFTVYPSFVRLCDSNNKQNHDRYPS